MVCGAPFAPRKNAKTCSPKCSTARTARRQRAYIKAHPAQKHTTEERYRAKVHRETRMLNRAVRLLFALTGETHAT